jgi:protoporphyrin/coproporphyrin ferrochelatase
VLKARAKLGDKRILLFSPSFVADCLETLHELEIEAKNEFLELGGTSLDCVPCPNSHPSWVQALAALIRKL